MNSSPSHQSIRLAGVPWKQVELELVVRPGDTLLFLVESDPEGAELLRLLLGLTVSERGSITLLGEDLRSLSQRELLRLRSRVGVIPATGGLISNLRLGENVGLPLDYHASPGRELLAKAVLQGLQSAGYRGMPTLKVNELSPLQRKQALLARAMLMEPELLLCDALTTGLNQSERDEFFTALLAFQHTAADRSTLLITSDRSWADSLPAVRRFDLLTGVAT